MQFLSDIFSLVRTGLSQLSQKGLFLTITSAFILSCICLIACNYYTRLWNKGYTVTVTHRVLSIFASALTFLFVLAFVGFSYFKESSIKTVDSWANEINTDFEWNSEIFKKAYDSVRAKGLESFEGNPQAIPASKTETRNYLSKLYVQEVCNHFNKKHSFLSKIIWVKPSIAPHEVEGDMSDFFANNPEKQYDLSKSVNLASTIIKNDLIKQTPKVVTTSKIILILAFVLVQAIPFGLIGIAAYKNLKVKS